MFLEKIEIQGFKSFAEPTTLLFNRELTAVVGPNGSGKSNIADAIRWVLGEQSLKLLRGKKSDDVIFAGSDTKGRLGFARVAISLNNSDKRAPIDYESLAIERAVDRSGESEYTLNGHKARLIDIQLLLARAAVGQKSYSVIGQGTIDNLLTFSAAERRDFFDEATGVRQFQMKKNQAMLKLDHTEENLTQAELVLQELEPRLRTLTRQVKRLERKETLERELNELQTNYYSFLTTQLVRELNGLYKKREAVESETTNLATALGSVQQTIDEHERAKSRDERFREMQEKLFQLQKEYNTLTKKKIVLEGTADLTAIKAGAADTVFAKQRAEDLENKLANIVQEEKTLAHDIQTATRRHATLLTEAKATETRLAKLEQQLVQGQRTTDGWGTIAKEAETLVQEHRALHTKLSEIEKLEELKNFRESHQVFTERLSSFCQTLKNRGDADHTKQWQQFKAVQTEHGRLISALHEAEVSHKVKEHWRETLLTHIAELTREQKQITGHLSNSEHEARQAQTVELGDIAKEIAEKEKAMSGVRDALDSFNQQEEKAKQELMGLQKKFRTIQYDQTIKNNELTTLKVEIAKYETRKEDLEKEIAQEAPRVTLTELTELNVAHTKEMIDAAKRHLAIIGGIDAETVNEYKEVNEKYTFLSQQTTDLRQAQKSLNSLIDELDEHIQKQFESGFKNINTMFSKYFRKLFNGGHTKLVLQIQLPEADVKEEADAAFGPAGASLDPEVSRPRGRPEREGGGEDSDDRETRDKIKKAPLKKKAKTFDYTVEIQATPPGKKLATIAMLSGGEKALTSIALICAIIAQNPPPFVVLDEVDAALDEANSIRFAEIIGELTDRTQFVTITHNRATMHQAKILYGVTMGTDGISKLLSVNFEEAEKFSKP